MVSKDNVLVTNTKCSCGSGDSENNQKGYFENTCPTCGKEGTLKIETINNVEVNAQSTDQTSNAENTNNVSEQPNKIVCTNCGAEFCGQDGYDLYGGVRSGLRSVNPNEITDENEDEEVSSTEENEPTYMSGWEGLCDLLRPLDAEAMIVQRGDYVIVKKIDMPQSAKLWAYEGINVVDDSVSITDYTPEIYNTFIIRWGESFENELEFVFDKHKNLFGERKCVLEAKKVQTVQEEGSDEEKKNEEENGGILSSISDMIFGGWMDDKTKDLEKQAGAEGVTGEESEEPDTEEVPITTREEAIQFGMKQVGKAKRDDGHTVELKVIGNLNWQMGEWCHVKLPSFNEDSYMFISKCSFESSPENEYINSLTLVDYPPTLGKPFSNSNETENKDEESEENSTENGENTENGETNGENNGTGTGSGTGTNGATGNS